jgi:hypothetical protein
MQSKLAFGSGGHYILFIAIHIFHSPNDPEWFALTEDRRGKGLPPGLEPWRVVRRSAMSATVKEVAAAALHDGRIARVIETDGYYPFRESSVS